MGILLSKLNRWFLHTGIFSSCTSAHYQSMQAPVYWRKLVLNILALLERKDTCQENYLTMLDFFNRLYPQKSRPLDYQQPFNLCFPKNGVLILCH